MNESVVLGHRYTGPEALEAGIVQQIIPGDQLLETAISFATKQGERGIDRDNLGSMKENMYYSIEQWRQKEMERVAKL